MKVYLSKLAEARLIELSDFLLENWGVNSKKIFINKLSKRINQISSQPKSCEVSPVFDGIFKCVVTKQTTFYYRILEEKSEIEIVTFFDSRQNPDALKELIK